MTPARISPNRPVPTGLPRSGHGRAVAGPRCGPLPFCAVRLADAAQTQPRFRRHPAHRSIFPEQGGLEAPAVTSIQTGSIRSP
jgi:hypothetical protein